MARPPVVSPGAVGLKFWAPGPYVVDPIIGYRVSGSDVTFTIAPAASAAAFQADAFQTDAFQADAAPADVTVTADAGSYAVSGAAVTFKVTEAAAANSYAITGTAAVFKTTTPAAAATAYAVTGTAAVFRTTAPATAGSYTVTGSAVVFRTIPLAAAGGYALTGSNATLTVTTTGTVAATAGAYSATGSAAVFNTIMPAGGEPWPDASTTGVEDGITLTDYSGPAYITTDDTLVENKIISPALGYDGIGVTGANVTIRNCRIESAVWGIEGSAATNLTVEHCDIIGPGAGWASNGGLVGQGTFHANDISAFAIGMQLGAGSSTVTDNYIHDLDRPLPDPHFDGITLFGGQDGVLIEHNTIIVPAAGGTASILITNLNAAIDDVTVRDNLMRGTPSYTAYSAGDGGVGTTTNILFENNVMQEGAFGYFNIVDTTPVIRGNTDYSTGELIADNTEAPALPPSGVVSYSLTGSDATFAITAPTTLVANAGSYSLTGSTATSIAKTPAAVGAYAQTGSTATLTATANVTMSAAAGNYVQTGSDVAFSVSGGSFTLFANPGAYNVTGSDVAFPGHEVLPPVQPAPGDGSGYTGAWSGPKRRKRKRDEIEELIDLVLASPPATPAVPHPAGPPPPPLIDLVPKMQAVGLTPPQRRTVKRAIVTDDPDDDEEAIELLLELLS